jgi:serine/threonine protein phosphatase PrpC
MEDRWTVDATPHGLLAAVYDGHGGAEAAARAAAGLPSAVLAALGVGLDPAEAFRRAFAELDATITDETCGTTVAALVVSGAAVTTAHVGDSRVVRVARRTATALTRDHRLDAPDERARVLRMGAELDPPYVVRGSRGLMVTRSLGDRWLRPVGVIAEPEVAHHALGPDDLALVAATDGLWDALDLAEAARLVRAARTPPGAAQALVQAALRSGARDNVTAVVVRVPWAG